VGSQRIRIGLYGSALAVAAVLLLLLFNPSWAPLRTAIHSVEARPRPTVATAQAVSGAAPAAARDERSHLADGLNSPAGDIHSDLRLINEIFIAYRAATRSENPVGENVEITAALRGKNRLGYAFIPADSPALNAKGELCDRWGTPFFFHQLSGQKMEVRSAGPDRKLWTADDQVLTP
jgi:hypothetical protein